MNLCHTLIAMAVLPLAACSVQPTEPARTTQPQVGMANPASVYCLKLGGRLEIVKEAAGQHGMCHLPDGTIIEEWELFRRDHPQGSKP